MMLRPAMAAIVLIASASFSSVAYAKGFLFDIHAANCAVSAADASDCEAAKLKGKKDYANALKGDYQAQRNTAYCLYTGCRGYRMDKAAACAWRIVIIASGHPKVDPSDTSNLTLCERQLSPAEMTAATGAAHTLFRRIYKRNLPSL